MSRNIDLLSAVEDNRSLTVTWNTGGFWVNTEEMVILDRSDQVESSDGIGEAQSWVAWHSDPNMRKRVVWDSDNNGWYQWNATSNTWEKDVNGKRLKWVNTENGFEFRPQ